MRSVKGIIIGFLLILLGFAAAQYSLIAAGILSAGGLAAVVVSALPKRAEKQEPQAAPAAPVPAPAELSAPELLPDILTVPLLIAGFAYSVFVSQWVIPAESVLGAVTGYMLPVVASAFLVWKNKDAFGGGDIKLLAALGAWLGMELVIYTMILASVLFVLYALARRMRVGAFGPAITIAAIMIAFYFF